MAFGGNEPGAIHNIEANPIRSVSILCLILGRDGMSEKNMDRPVFHLSLAI